MSKELEQALIEVGSFNGRSGAVVAETNDYYASMITDDSDDGPGTTVADAIAQLAAIPTVNLAYGRIGSVVATAGDYRSSQLGNDSADGVGANLADALDDLSDKLDARDVFTEIAVSLTSNQANWSPTGWGTADAVCVDPDAVHVVSSLAAPTASGRGIKLIVNVSTDTEFVIGATQIDPGAVVRVEYSETDEEWLVSGGVEYEGPTFTSIFGSEPPVYWHADDAAGDDGDPVASLTGRTTYDATGISSPTIDDDGWGGTHKTINVTGTSRLSAPSAAAAAHVDVEEPFTMVLAAHFALVGSFTPSVPIGLGKSDSSFPFQIVHITTGSSGRLVELWSDNSGDAALSTGPGITNNAPVILGITYDGSQVTIIERSASGDTVMLDAEPHAPEGSSVFDTLTLGTLDRSSDYGPTPMRVRCFVDLPGVSVNQATLLQAIDYVENTLACPL